MIVDVRRQDEYAEGHIPGAICIPNEMIEDTQPAELPDLDQVILVYCRSGRRSKEAAQKLFDIGYTSVPAKNGLSDKIAKDLKKRGFKYLGSVTVYAHLQASGMVNDHGEDCVQYRKLIEKYPTVTKRRYKES